MESVDEVNKGHGSASHSSGSVSHSSGHSGGSAIVALIVFFSIGLFLVLFFICLYCLSAYKAQRRGLGLGPVAYESSIDGGYWAVFRQRIWDLMCVRL